MKSIGIREGEVGSKIGQNEFLRRLHDNYFILLIIIYLLPVILAFTNYQSYQKLFALYIVPVAALAWLKGLKGGFYSIGISSFFVILYNLILQWRHQKADLLTDAYMMALIVVIALFIGHLGQYMLIKQRQLEISNHRLNRVNKKLAKFINELEELSLKDGLTALYNHRYFHEKLGAELNKAKSDGIDLTLLFIDIDYFKHYNDIYGHVNGDKVLKDFAKVLNKSLDEADIAFRYGGEEFAVVCVGADITKARQTAEKIKYNIQSYPFYGREEQPGGTITVSIGIAGYPVHCGEKAEMVKLADEALYKAKNKSRNRIEVYNSVINQGKIGLSDNEKRNLNTLKTLLLIINARDRYTYGHSERVVEYVAKIADKLGMDESEITRLKVGAFLHDIGKIEIPSEILNKKVKLADDEMELIRMHPVIGAESVSAIRGLKDIVNCVLHHHERYDGKGYPSNLIGNQIPLGARIIALADSFDAMTSKRPYHFGKTIPEAILEIERCAGSQFDPDIADVFIDILQGEITAQVC